MGHRTSILPRNSIPSKRVVPNHHPPPLCTRKSPPSPLPSSSYPLPIPPEPPPQSCVSARHFTIALPILQTPITNIDTSLSDLTYLDNLKYHYVGGIALAALGRWDEAEDFFEICIGSPAVVPSAVQLEALKKLKLVQLIARGKVRTAHARACGERLMMMMMMMMMLVIHTDFGIAAVCSSSALARVEEYAVSGVYQCLSASSGTDA